MPRLLVTSDFHLDAVTAGVQRFADLEAAVDQTVQAAINERVDAYLFLGDLCDPDSGSIAFECARVAVGAALWLAGNGIESHWLAGNHDVVEDGSGRTTLAPLKELCDEVHVHEQPELLLIPDAPDGVPALALPYPAQARRYDPDAFIRGVLGGDRVQFVFGHLMLDGIVPGSESGDLARGRDVPWPLAALRERCPVARLLGGHYHRRQRHAGVWIPGALGRLTFGEEQHEPGYLLVEV